MGQGQGPDLRSHGLGGEHPRHQRGEAVPQRLPRGGHNARGVAEPHVVHVRGPQVREGVVLRAAAPDAGPGGALQVRAVGLREAHGVEEGGALGQALEGAGRQHRVPEPQQERHVGQQRGEVAGGLPPVQHHLGLPPPPVGGGGVQLPPVLEELEYEQLMAWEGGAGGGAGGKLACAGEGGGGGAFEPLSRTPPTSGLP